MLSVLLSAVFDYAPRSPLGDGVAHGCRGDSAHSTITRNCLRLRARDRLRWSTKLPAIIELSQVGIGRPLLSLAYILSDNGLRYEQNVSVMTSPVVIERDCGRISRIRPYLYLSGIGPLSPQNLQKFSCVVNCIAGFRHVVPSHLTVLHIPIEDDENTDLTPYWQLVFQTIDANKKLNGKVLIFCGMGISRSPAFVMAYLLCIERMSLHDAYKHVQKCRNIVCPNVGFFRQLIELEEKIMGKRTVNIIQPIAGVEVADVVWNEIYVEVMLDLQKSALPAAEIADVTIAK